MEQSHHVIQPHLNEHLFLKSLNDCKDVNNISSLIKEKLGLLSLFTSSHKKIYESAITLMKDVVKMDSFSDAQKEIAGAINGLTILLRNEQDKNNKELIQKELNEACQFEKEIKDIFIIKEAIASKKDLTVKINRDLIIHFESIQDLFGKNRRLDPQTILEFVQLWQNNETNQILRKFIKSAKEVRTLNLELLREDKYSFSPTVAINQALLLSHIDLTRHCHIGNYTQFHQLIDHIVNNRCLVTNTQLNTNGFYLAFNSEDTNPLSEREKSVATHAKKLIPTLEQDSKESSEKSESEDVIAKRTNKLEFLKEGYVPRIGLCYQLSRWEPSIGPQDPIQPLQRIIGFAIEEGLTANSRTSLDFASILGEGNLNLNLEERKLLSELLFICEAEFDKDIDVFDKFQISRETPLAIQELFIKFNDDSLPHLKQLTDDKKNRLVQEALVFIKLVNLSLYRDLLNL